MGYFKDGEYIESEFYEEPIYGESSGLGENRKGKLLNNEKLDPDVIDAEGVNLGKAGSNAKANAEAWAQYERSKLEKQARAEDIKAEFQVTEGKGLARAGKLSFGNEKALETEDRRDERALGRFNENRLIL